MEADLKDRHGGWKNPRTKRRYSKRSPEELTEVTKAMNLLSFGLSLLDLSVLALWRGEITS